ncbi:phosphocholine-specific phospholipase C [Chitinophaga sp.]|uniref:phosphocholine-specific phospholipase C n=1 Tax=Chitinophaga sp. TaxID=1869181 RepID=UPI00261275B3|nr:phospholipase C, phosphocholine-specific [uncultured Chitinophaga sp.]
MDNRREFLRKSMLLSGAAGLSSFMPASIQRALAIEPAPGSSWADAEHIVILMQENRSFDHCFGTLQGVRGFNDPRAITLPDKKPVWLQTDKEGKTYSPFRLDLKDSRITWMGALPHGRHDQVDANNKGKYDQWLLVKQSGKADWKSMPLTLGYFTREDIPFNYALADAFTICDQNFCSAMTSTTPNRSFFWTGKITVPENGAAKAHIRNTDYSYGKLGWETFPELLSKAGVEWKFYQNDLSCGGGFQGEERSWLANFGCNLLEFFKVYNVQFSDRYVTNLQKQIDELPAEIRALTEASPSSEEVSKKNQAAIKKKQEVLDKATEEMGRWGKERYAQLSEKEKDLFHRAFVINKNDPQFRKLSQLEYDDNGKKRTLPVPSGDLFYQFRSDVEGGKLPAVSWLASPQNFSDHPSAPWYGAWYVSEVMDILTKNPEVWKKTIFIVTYDENDGYYDHVPPFSIPDNNKPGTGKVSAGIDTEIEHVRLANELAQGVAQKHAREAPIGLGYRVPLLIASPWSRGGKVCSQVFDHTSTLQFLETFVEKKYKKKIRSGNISEWRRTICGDLTAAFSETGAVPSSRLPFLEQKQFIEAIYSAQFKDLPSGFREISGSELDKMIAQPELANPLAKQETGTRPSTFLPYELYASGYFDAASKAFVINMGAGNQLFGKRSAGSPFTVYAPESYAGEVCRNWHFASKAGDRFTYAWPLAEFDNGKYALRLHGPNGFFREFRGTQQDPGVRVDGMFETTGKAKTPTGNLILQLQNRGAQTVHIKLKDHGYGKNDNAFALAPGARKEIIVTKSEHKGWYDFSVLAEGFAGWEQRFAGRAESGKETITDPVMGKAIG